MGIFFDKMRNVILPNVELDNNCTILFNIVVFCKYLCSDFILTFTLHETNNIIDQFR